MNFEQVLKKILSSPLASGAAGGLLSGGLIGALGNKQARKALGGAAKLGGAAAVGALALAALQRYQAQQAGAPLPPASAGPLAVSAPALEREASLVVQAMLSAAHADGSMDASERARIAERLRAAGFDDAEFDYVMSTLNGAADPHRIAALAQNETEAAEIYAASLLAVDVDHWAEQAYLRELKSGLKLPEALAAMLEAEVKTSTPA